MILEPGLNGNTTTGVALTKTPNGMFAIEHPGCAAVIWEREPAKQFQDWIEALHPDQLPQTRTIIRPHLVQQAMTDIVEASALPDCQERQMLVDDIAAMASIFAGILQLDHIRIRLEKSATPSSDDFHTIEPIARLVCAYRGQGVQFGIGTDQTTPTDIFDLATGSAIVLRGQSWPESPKTGLVHRAPPHNRENPARLVLTIDPVTDSRSAITQQLIH